MVTPCKPQQDKRTVISVMYLRCPRNVLFEFTFNLAEGAEKEMERRILVHCVPARPGGRIH